MEINIIDACSPNQAKIKKIRIQDKKIALELTRLYFSNKFDSNAYPEETPLQVFKHYWRELAIME